jgi:hypothetical protein
LKDRPGGRREKKDEVEGLAPLPPYPLRTERQGSRQLLGIAGGEVADAKAGIDHGILEGHPGRDLVGDALIEMKGVANEAALDLGFSQREEDAHRGTFVGANEDPGRREMSRDARA